MRRAIEIEFVVGAFGAEERLAEVNLGAVVNGHHAMIGRDPGIREFEITDKARSS